MEEVIRPALILGGIAFVAACKPPATDQYVERAELEEDIIFASDPLPSPDTENAIWAGSQSDLRLIYGTPGQTPVLALACELDDGMPVIRFTRYAPADEGAGALFALVGNGIAARLPVDAVSNGDDGKGPFLWEGVEPAASGDWDVLTGPKEVTATLPGAGKLVLNPSPRPARLITECRQANRPAQPE